MSDHRSLAANGRVADIALEGRIEAQTYTAGMPRLVSVPLADLLRAPDGPRERQLQAGDAVTVFEDHADWSFVRAARDGYVGYLRSEHVTDGAAPTHRVVARATHVYSEPDMKAPETCSLGHGARVAVTGTNGKFAALADGGYVFAGHLAPVATFDSDRAAVAGLYLGVPYLWGGNSIFGIDCSGLVQAACLACGIDCPGDSDQQCETLGRAIDDDATLRRNDLIFWKGHVALCLDAETIIHATAHPMAVVTENLGEAIDRIAAAGDGQVLARRRFL